MFDDVPNEIDYKTVVDVQPVQLNVEKSDATPTNEKVTEKLRKSSTTSKAAATSNAMALPDDNDSDLFEIEESEAPLVPLYHLRDEGLHKWVLLSDLCYVLKVKSKDALLKQVN